MDIRITSNDSFINSPSTAAIMKTPKVVRKSPAEEERSIIKETARKIALETTPAYTIEISSGGRAALEAIRVMGEKRINYNESADDIINSSDDIALNNETDEAGAVSEQEDSYEVNAASEQENPYEVNAVSEQENPYEAGTVSEQEDADETVTNETGLTDGNEAVSADEEDLTTVLEDIRVGESDSAAVSMQELSNNSENQPVNQVSEEAVNRTDMGSELNRSSSNSFEAVPQVLKEAIAAYNYQMSYQINAAVMQ